MTHLATAAPWLWVGAAVGFGAAERLFGVIWPLWVALAALATGVALWSTPQLGFGAQVGLFLALAVTFVTVGARLGRPVGAGRARAAAAQALVGREAEVVAFRFHEGQVAVDGATWPARLDGSNSRTPDVGERMRIIATDGRVVWVRTLKSDDRPTA